MHTALMFVITCCMVLIQVDLIRFRRVMDFVAGIWLSVAAVLLGRAS
jgi:hypothetical protein